MTSQTPETPILLEVTDRRYGEIFWSVLRLAHERGFNYIVKGFLQKEAKRWEEDSISPKSHKSQARFTKDVLRQQVAEFAFEHLQEIDWEKFGTPIHLDTQEGRWLYGLQIGFVEYIINSEAAYVLGNTSNLPLEVSQVYRDEWERSTKQHFAPRLVLSQTHPSKPLQPAERAEITDLINYFTSSLPENKYIQDREMDLMSPLQKEQLLFYTAFENGRFSSYQALPSMARTTTIMRNRV